MFDIMTYFDILSMTDRGECHGLRVAGKPGKTGAGGRAIGAPRPASGIAIFSRADPGAGKGRMKM
jgi:hypothetical protein